MQTTTETLPAFELLGLAPELIDAIRDAGYREPTPIQAQAIPLALRGRDLIGLAQTGTGKTAAFTLPIVQRLLGGPRRLRALILTPTRELAARTGRPRRRRWRWLFTRQLSRMLARQRCGG